MSRLTAFLALPTPELGGGGLPNHVHLTVRQLNSIVADPPPRIAMGIMPHSRFTAMVLPIRERSPSAANVLRDILGALCDAPFKMQDKHGISPSRPARITTSDARLAAFLLEKLGEHGTAVEWIDESKTLITESTADSQGRSQTPLNAIVDSAWADQNDIMVRLLHDQSLPAACGAHENWEVRQGNYVSLVEKSYGQPIPIALLMCCACDTVAPKAIMRQHDGKNAYCSESCRRRDSDRRAGPAHSVSDGTSTPEPEAEETAGIAEEAREAAAATSTAGSPTVCEPEGLACGVKVRLHGLKTTLLNGVCGTISAQKVSSGRWPVELMSGKVVKIKPQNLRADTDGADICPLCLDPLPTITYDTSIHDKFQAHTRRLFRFPCCGKGACHSCVQTSEHYIEGEVPSVLQAGNSQQNVLQMIAGTCPCCRARQPEPDMDPRNGTTGNYHVQKIKLLENRCEAGVFAADALYRLGNMAEARGDIDLAIDYYQRAADEGPGHSADAERALGWLYYSGTKGVAKDKAKAHEYFERAANRGHAEALFDLGIEREKYAPGDTNVNISKAIRLYRLAAAQQYPPARLNLGLLLTKSENNDPAETREAIEMLRENVNEANDCALESAYNLGCLLTTAPSPFRNLKKALELHKIVASFPSDDRDFDQQSEAKFLQGCLLLGIPVNGVTADPEHLPNLKTSAGQAQRDRGGRLIREAFAMGNAHAIQVLESITEDMRSLMLGPEDMELEPCCLPDGCTTVVINGLQGSPELNDRIGTVEGYDASKGRFRVRIEGERRVKQLRAVNIAPPWGWWRA